MRDATRLAAPLGVLVMLALSFTACGAAPATPAPAPVYDIDTVKRVVDGDTIVTEGQQKSIRILGIDSPETKDPRKPVQCGGPESAAWAKATLPPGTTVRLVKDPTQGSVDLYKRPLRRVLFLRDGAWVDFSEASAGSGNARSYVFRNNPVLGFDKIKAAEKDAQENRRGLWGHC